MHTVLMISMLISQLVRTVWLMEPMAARAYFPAVKAILNNTQVDLQTLMPQASSTQQDETPKYYGDIKAMIERQNREFNCMSLHMEDAIAVRPSYSYGFDKAPKNSVSLIPIHDVIMKYDFCGSAGTTTMSRWLQEADAHPNIIGHILSIDSPGGSVNGTSDFASLILSLNKPVVAFCHGNMCSAAYWIGSSAKEIIASNHTCIIGSIGTYLHLEDNSKHLENEGIKSHDIYATQSGDKNAVVREAFAGNYDLVISSLLNPMNEVFITAVKKNRYGTGMKQSEVLTGKTFVGQAALNVGLIDKIGTLADAVKSVQKFSKS